MEDEFLCYITTVCKCRYFLLNTSDFDGVRYFSVVVLFWFYQCYPATGMPDDQGEIMSPGTKSRDGHCHVTSAADGMGTSSGSWHRCHFSKSDGEVRESRLAGHACSRQEKFLTLRKMDIAC